MRSYMNILRRNLSTMCIVKL